MKKTIQSHVDEQWVEFKFKKGETKTRRYFVSNYGRVKSVDKKTGAEGLVKGSLDNRGNPRVNIRLQNGYENIFIYRFVAENFVDRPSEDHCYVIQLDLNKKNNHWKNLKWATEQEWKEWVKKRAIKYNFKRPKGGGYYKLTAAQVAIIKKYLKSGKTRKKMIAKRFGVTHTQINRIERGENWGHIKPAE